MPGKQFSVVLILFLAVAPLFAGEFKFTVTNHTKTKIVGLYASEDKKKWLPFDIGSGITPGATVTIIWDEHTGESSCTWSIKASYEDGTESEPAQFDFCKQTDIEFNG